MAEIVISWASARIVDGLLNFFVDSGIDRTASTWKNELRKLTDNEATRVARGE